MVRMNCFERHSVSAHREIKAQYIFEKETSAIKYPELQDGKFWSNFKLGALDYLSLIRSRRECIAFDRNCSH